MFARWRNLAAAAGAFCLPISLVHASPQTSETQYTQTTPCTRRHEITEQSWFRTERDSWYQRYYGNTLDDGTTNGMPPILSPSLSFQTIDQPNVIILDIEPIDEASQAPAADPNIEECDDPTCPCHDVVNLDDDQEDDEPASDRTSATRRTISDLDIESTFFDVYAPYVPATEMNEQNVQAEKAAQLAGTIEPMFEDCESDSLGEWLCGDRESQRDSAIILNEIDPIAAPDDSAPDDLDDDSATESDDSEQGAPRFHMFYPGCDWSPYYPASQSGGQSKPLLPEDLRSA